MGKLTCGLSIPGVFERDGRYYKVVRNEWIKLSRVDEGVRALHRALFELDPARPRTIGQMIDFYRSAGMDDLKPHTQARYGLILKRLDHHFGHVDIGTLKRSQVAVFLEARRKRGRGAISANRERAVLSSVHEFGMRQGWIEENPCRGVRRNTEKPRKRYVTDAEFLEAFERSPEPFQDLIAVAFLSGLRETDLINLKRVEHLRPEGIVFTESKTDKPHTKQWSDALRFFVRRAMERFPESEYVLTNKFGAQWSVWAINSQKRRLGLSWAFRDLRSKAQTDSTHSVLGHGAAMEGVYRKMLITRPVR